MERLHCALAYFLGAYCGRFGDWALHRLGWYAFRVTHFERPHKDGCAGADLEFLPRAGGYTKQCRSCGSFVHVHLSFWETEQGKVPPETTTWIVEVVRASLPA